MSPDPSTSSLAFGPVTFYVQAGSRVGLGHLARSAAVMRGLEGKGVASRLYLDADTLGHNEARERALSESPDLSSGSGPVVIDALHVPDSAADWLAGFRPRILISPICNRADLATHVLVRESPEALQSMLPEDSVLITDPAFAFATAEGLVPRSREYSSLVLGICLTGGDDVFDMDELLDWLSEVPGLHEIRLVDRRRPRFVSRQSPTLSHREPNQHPWGFLGEANVFLGGEGVMIAEALAQGIPVLSLSHSSQNVRNKPLVDTGAVEILPRDPFDPQRIINLLSTRERLLEMHRAALRTANLDHPHALVRTVVDILIKGSLNE